MHVLSGEQGQTKILVFLTKYLPAAKLVMYIGTFRYKGTALFYYEVFLCSKWNSQLIGRQKMAHSSGISSSRYMQEQIGRSEAHGKGHREAISDK